MVGATPGSGFWVTVLTEAGDPTAGLGFLLASPTMVVTVMVTRGRNGSAQLRSGGGLFSLVYLKQQVALKESLDGITGQCWWPTATAANPQPKQLLQRWRRQPRVFMTSARWKTSSGETTTTDCSLLECSWSRSTTRGKNLAYPSLFR
ncbi:hypothetical protein L1987_40282 [Smallanthus sonchifolius]|uniref:Uncharacterized protein n=1 Tax=Smallanthus sonchifolius TaxID=185202 RepID=A0ACB9GSW2_9ASTR|nr:hypothetical protein L1987_40282 [Smallanthus sonchifolius]